MFDFDEVLVAAELRLQGWREITEEVEKILESMREQLDERNYVRALRAVYESMEGVVVRSRLETKAAVRRAECAARRAVAACERDEAAELESIVGTVGADELWAWFWRVTHPSPPPMTSQYRLHAITCEPFRNPRGTELMNAARMYRKRRA